MGAAQPLFRLEGVFLWPILPEEYKHFEEELGLVYLSLGESMYEPYAGTPYVYSPIDFIISFL